VDGLQHIWDGASAQLVPLFESARRQVGGGAAAVGFSGAEGSLALRVEVYRLGGDDCDEYLVLLNDPRILETLESDVRLASQLDGLARTYRTVAHELRAPLSAVMINLDLLRESLVVSDAEDDALKDRQKRYVSILGEEFARLNRSLAELLTQTTPPNEPQRPFDLVQLIRDLGTLLAPQARRQSVDLALRVPEEAVPLVGYRDRLKQALLNIAVNALEALPTGGRVVIEVEAREARARVRVTDSGAGIAPELLPRIYENDFTTKGGGSGIGLYVARALVQMHGGQIQVESEPGDGTQVTVELPLVRPT
jgi:two-component system sensor histidine kinase HydH